MPEIRSTPARESRPTPWKLDFNTLRQWWGTLGHLHPGAVLAKGKHPPRLPSQGWLGNLQGIQSDPLQFLLQNALDYGDIFSYRVGIWNIVVVNHPEYVKHILQDQPKKYSKANIDYALLKWVLGEGLLTSEGDFWLRQRRMLQPLFHRERIGEMADLMVACALERVEAWKTHKTQRTDLATEMMSLTLQIVGKSLFSLDLLKEAHAVGEAFTFINEYIGTVDPFSILLPPFPYPKRLLLQKAVGALDRVVLDLLAARRKTAGNPEAENKKDLIGMLLAARDEETGQGMEDEQIRDELVTMMLAGHETTALALTWTFALLSQHPEVEQRLAQEIQTVLGSRPATLKDLAALPYAKMVLEESMRLYPPAWAMTRLVEEDDQIAGYDIPARSIVVVSPYLTHRNPKIWPNPQGFQPERFTEEAAVGRHRFAYFPFGGGQRLCIGRAFALTEAHLLLVTLLQAFRFDLAPAASLEPAPRITLRPKHGLPVLLIPRKG